MPLLSCLYGFIISISQLNIFPLIFIHQRHYKVNVFSYIKSILVRYRRRINYTKTSSTYFVAKSLFENIENIKVLLENAENIKDLSESNENLKDLSKNTENIRTYLKILKTSRTYRKILKTLRTYQIILKASRTYRKINTDSGKK